MNDDLKTLWRSQAAPQRLTLDAALVLNEVRRNERQFAATIYWRDAREVGGMLVLAPLWIHLGIQASSPWSWYLAVPMMLWVAGFMIVDRLRQRRCQPRPGDSLRDSVNRSLSQVEHQIWLLRNIFWWYLLPTGAGLIVFPADLAWRSRDQGLKALVVLAAAGCLFALVFGVLYWANQRAVRHQLEPRRQELQALLASLDDSGKEPADD